MVRLLAGVYQAKRNPHKLVTARLRHPILFGNRVFAGKSGQTEHLIAKAGDHDHLSPEYFDHFWPELNP